MWLQKDLIREWGYSLDTVVEDRSLEKKSARDSIFTLREICKRKSSERNVVGEVDDGSKHVPGVGVTSHFGLVALFFVVDVRILSSTTRGSTKRDVGRRTEIVEQVMEVGGGRWRSVEVGGGRPTRAAPPTCRFDSWYTKLPPRNRSTGSPSSTCCSVLSRCRESGQQTDHANGTINTRSAERLTQSLIKHVTFAEEPVSY